MSIVRPHPQGSPCEDSARFTGLLANPAEREEAEVGDCKHDGGFSHCSECCDEEQGATHRRIHSLREQFAQLQQERDNWKAEVERVRTTWAANYEEVKQERDSARAEVERLKQRIGEFEA